MEAAEVKKGKGKGVTEKATRGLSRDTSFLRMTASEGRFSGQGGQRGAKMTPAPESFVFTFVRWWLGSRQYAGMCWWCMLVTLGSIEP